MEAERVLAGNANPLIVSILAVTSLTHGQLAAPVNAQCDPIETAQILAGNGEASDEFGYSVTVFNDTLVIGARADDTSNGADAGSVYVFVRDGAQWVLQAQLIATDGAAGDGFGRAVALYEDTIIVGAWLDDTSAGSDAGSAYVFTRREGTWSQRAKLTAPDGGPQHNFGVSVAIAGDSVVVGSIFAVAPNGTNGGAAYVFRRDGVNWTFHSKLTAFDASANDNFGISVAIWDTTIVVGAHWDNTSGGADAGSAYVFVQTSGTWTHQARLNASDGATGDRFGRSVALFGDTSLVGAYWDDTSAGVDSGSAYLFVRTGTTWTQQAKLMALDASAGDWFGYAVALSANTAVVGAWLDDTDAGENAGSVYVYTRNPATWTQRTNITPNDGSPYDAFGVSCAIYDETLLVGAYWDDTPFGADAGSAYVFDLSPIRRNGDIDGDNDVDIADLSLLIDVLLGLSADANHIERADLNCSGTADGDDIAVFLTALML